MNKNAVAAIRRIESMGWLPNDPSPECLAATARPEMPSQALDETDRLGIHALLVATEMLILLDGKTKDEREDTRGVVETASVLHAVRETGTDLSQFTTQEYSELKSELADWRDGPLHEAQQRIRATASDEGDREPDEFYEPALTLLRLTHDAGWIDEDADVGALKTGLYLSDRRGASPNSRNDHKKAIAGMSADAEQVADLVWMLTGSNPTRSVARVTRAAKIGLAPSKIRDGLAKVTEGIKPIREERGVPIDFDMADARRSGCDAIDARDSLEHMAALLDLLQRECPSESLRAIAIEHYLAIKDPDNPITAKSVAEEIGTSPENLRRQIRLIDGYMEEMLAG